MTRRAAVFAGQGAQAVGMGRDLAEGYAECKRMFEQADAVLGFPLSRICFEGPAEDLTKTRYCQPAIFVMSMACWAGLQKEVAGVRVDAVAGLSLGEWSALHMAGVLGFEDTLRVLEARGRFMQEACEEREGGMLSVLGLDVDKLTPICQAAGVEIANLNSPGQTVLSGEKAKILEAERLAKAGGATRTVVLNVAGAYHSSLMSSAAKKLETFLAGIQLAPPSVPVWSNVTGKPHGDVESIRRTMVQQVTSPVQWISIIESMAAEGIHQYLELGPGKVLSGLIKRIDKDAVLGNIQDAATLKKGAAMVQPA